MKVNRKETEMIKYEGIMADGFGIVPKRLLVDNRLSSQAKCLYMYFATLTSNTFPARDTILNDLNLSKDTYYKHLNKLIECGYIKVEKIEGSKRKMYILVQNDQKQSTDKDIEVISNKNEDSNQENSNQNEDIISDKNEVEKDEVKEKKRNIEIKEKLGIDSLCEKYPEEAERIKTIYKAVIDMLNADKIKISGTIRDKENVAEILEDMDEKNVLYVLGTFISGKYKIKSKRAWIQACIINSAFDDKEEIDKRVEFVKKKIVPEVEKNKVDTGEKIDNEINEIVEDPYIKERKKKINSLFCKISKAKINGNNTIINQYEKMIQKLDKELFEYNTSLAVV